MHALGSATLHTPLLSTWLGRNSSLQNTYKTCLQTQHNEMSLFNRLVFIAMREITGEGKVESEQSSMPFQLLGKGMGAHAPHQSPSGQSPIPCSSV